MSRHPYRWGLVAVLVVAVLIAGLLVLPWGGGKAVAKEPRATLGKIMIPPAAFIPSWDGINYENFGDDLITYGGRGMFNAPLSFPVPVVNIRKITLIAHDNAAGGREVCVSLKRAQPLTADQTHAGSVCTSDSTDAPQRVATTAISPRRVNTVNHGPHLLVAVHPDTIFWGVQVVYTY